MTGSKSGSSRSLPARRVVLAWLLMTLLAILATLSVGERMRRGIFDSWQSMSPRELSQTDVRVVMIDDFSVEHLGPWPWPRYYLARLTEELANRGAKVIAYDILFPEQDRLHPATVASLYPELSPTAAAEVRALEPMDLAFGRVIGSTQVVLAHAGVARAPQDQLPLADSPIKGRLPPAVHSWPAELGAIPELDDVAVGTGLINVPPDSDGVFRSVPMLMRAGQKPRPGFALEIARNVLGAEVIEAEPDRARIAGREVPLDRRGRLRLHFGSFPPDRIVPAAWVLAREEELPQSKNLPRDMFAGKSVIVGVSAEGSSDIVATPLAAEEFGPLVQAQAVDSILRGGWLVRPSWSKAVEWGLAGLLAVLALGNIYFGRNYRIFLAIIFTSLPVASCLAFAKASLLLDPARPMLVGGGAVAGVALGLFALARIDRERLREALFQERIAAAETEGELQAARAIQLGMVPPRDRLRSLDPRIDLDALLEPARSIGGDYYDALKIGDDQIGFAIADVTGKGVPAALFMAMSKALTSAALSRMQADPATMAAAINSELLKDSGDTMSVTMLLGIIDLRDGSVQLVCAGHEDPLLLGADGILKPVRLEGGVPLCIGEFEYPLEKMRLEPGETLILVTDGVTEAQNSKGELFGRSRIAVSGSDATAIIDSIRDQVRRFEEGTEATDDLTVMAVHYLGDV